MPTVFWFLLTCKFSSSSNFCHIPFIKIIDDGLGIRQIFLVSEAGLQLFGHDISSAFSTLFRRRFTDLEFWRILDSGSPGLNMLDLGNSISMTR
ncbi:hypothetical protein RhiirB3_450847 [Rhizophagus irregularis]|nr:hypothetical protein RhiirB3_450847 [Rhizophagus irregularis]